MTEYEFSIAKMLYNFCWKRFGSTTVTDAHIYSMLVIEERDADDQKLIDAYLRAPPDVSDKYCSFDMLVYYGMITLEKLDLVRRFDVSTGSSHIEMWNARVYDFKYELKPMNDKLMELL